MAKVEFNVIIDKAQGALSKQGLITRQKTYRDERGRIIGYGKREGYFIAHPRNYKRNPMVGKELEHHNLWREVCLQAKEELANAELRAQWQLRFEAQLYANRSSRPDAQAPIDPSTGAQKRYCQLYAFVRAMIYQSKIAEHSNG